MIKKEGEYSSRGKAGNSFGQTGIYDQKELFLGSSFVHEDEMLR